MSTSLYTIAVHMTMMNHAAPVLTAIAHQVTGLHHHINAATAASLRFRAALIGAGTALVSGGLLRGMASLVNHGAEFSRVIDRMRLAGWSPGDISHATAQAFDLARVYPSLSASFIMEMQREMAPALGSREEALHMAGSMARLTRVLEIHRGPGHTHAIHQDIIAAVRAGELSANTLTDTRFAEFLDLMVPSINAWGGLVTPRDLAQFFQYARQSGIGLSDRFIRDIAPTLIQEMRASGTGTAFQTMMQAMVGGRMRLRALNAWNELGLLDRSQIDPDNLTPEGRLRRIQPGLIRQTGLLMSDPDRWAHQVLVPAMITAGRFTQEDYAELVAGNLRTGGGAKAREAITMELYRLFGDRTGQGLMGTLIQQIRKIAKDAVIVGQSHRMDSSQELIEENYGMALAGVRGSWQTLNEALALPNMETATGGLRMLSSVLGSITASVRGLEPGTARAIIVGISVGLATLFVLGIGAIVVAIAGWPIIIGAAVVGALAAAGVYIRSKWEAITDWWTGVMFRIEGHISTIRGWGEAIAGAFGAIQTAIANFVGWLRSFVPGLPGGGTPGAGVPDMSVPGFTPLPAPSTPGGLMHRQSWVPPASQPSVVPIRHELTIDGHKIGEAVSHYIARAAAHVQSAAQFDSGLALAPVDMQVA